MLRLPDQIKEVRVNLMRSKPHSRRRVELQIRLRDLVLKQLRAEHRHKPAQPAA